MVNNCMKKVELNTEYSMKHWHAGEAYARLKTVYSRELTLYIAAALFIAIGTGYW